MQSAQGTPGIYDLTAHKETTSNYFTLSFSIRINLPDYKSPPKAFSSCDSVIIIILFLPLLLNSMSRATFSSHVWDAFPSDRNQVALD